LVVVVGGIFLIRTAFAVLVAYVSVTCTFNNAAVSHVTASQSLSAV